MGNPDLTFDRHLNYRNEAQIALAKDKDHNPEITMYYNSDGDLIKVKEVYQGRTIYRNITGTKPGGAPISQSIDYSVVYSPWSLE